ncbi:MAG: hypothetical protein UV94_C0019G0002 [Parcubacteria group bacterium GW2011_GWC1_43_30]|nr:MAG: hypothetical protein UV94_C0019G0002 [Parcubacteria group bacterium GW2011_GWC1_43_30]
MSKGLLSSIFGFSEAQAEKDEKDVKEGNAVSARNDAEVTAKADWMVDDVQDSSSSGSGKGK